MARYFAGIVAAFVLTTAITAPATADNNLDFDGDGVSEILSVEASGSAKRWRAAGSTGEFTLNTEFGLATDTAIPGRWISPDEISLAVVRFDPSRKSITWEALKPDKLIAERTFGKGGDYVITGADFDGNGIADAAIMRVRNKRFNWIIRYDLFAQADPKQRRVTFGSVGQRIFFARGTDELDWLGVFGPGKSRSRKALLALKNPRGKGDEKGQFARSLVAAPRPRPVPIQGPDGTSHVVFSVQGAANTRVGVYELSGTRVFDESFPGVNTLIVGDFDGEDAGEEVLLSTPSRLLRYNPFSRVPAELTPVGGTLVGAFQVQQFATATPTAAPTVAPTATVAVTPTATPTKMPT